MIATNTLETPAPAQTPTSTGRADRAIAVAAPRPTEIRAQDMHKSFGGHRVYENVALALREVKGMEESDVRVRVEDVVDAVGLNVAKDMSLDRCELSGGMAKRVGIARALALDPALIFYDEPTSGLDPHLAHQIQDLIMEAHSRPRAGEPRTSVLVTHDKDLLYRLRPRVIMLHDGYVAFDGTYDGFQNSDLPVIRPYFELMPGLHQRFRA